LSSPARIPSLTRAVTTLLVTSLSIFAAACGDTPSGPTPTLTCPAAVTVGSTDGNPVAVTFQPPALSTVQPVTATCTPASGSLFSIGTTAVSCSAFVSNQRPTCSFNVTVTAPPRLDKTRVLAFGDSITFGSSDLCPGGSSSQSWTPAELLPWANPIPAATSYPSVLQTMLRGRYTAQNPVVVNAGLAGEAANDGDTRRRFTRALNEQSPEILLLQEGINDLHGLDFYGIPHATGIANLVRALQDMSNEARGRGIRVFLGTLLPQRPNRCRSYAIPPRSTVDLIAPTNNQIRSMAAAQGLDLIDLFALMEPQLDTLIGQDGLHPTTAGYNAMAQAFFDAIRQKVEVTPAPATAVDGAHESGNRVIW
jgi:lysophospholipase L1-like esterase